MSAAKLHSAFLRLAVIYACDFTAAKKHRNEPKRLNWKSDLLESVAVTTACYVKSDRRSLYVRTAVSDLPTR